VTVTYRLPAAKAAAEVERTEHGWWVRSLRVPARKRWQGFGTALLRAICEDADACGCAVRLNVQPEGGGMVYGELVRWYERHGFVGLPDGSGLMERQARGRRAEWEQVSGATSPTRT
jgi:GNAT superfamily N-acetyltransferase